VKKKASQGAPGPVNANGRLLEAWPEALYEAQRALYYGDGLFESLRVFEGRAPLWERHWERMVEGMHRIGLVAPPHWTADYFDHELRRTAPANARVRWMVWRASGGLYLPLADQAQYLIAAAPAEGVPFPDTPGGLALCTAETVRLPVDGFSNLKTFNAARYVQAAREAAARGCHDALLLNAYGRVCETSNSNVFWVKAGVVHTPPATDGCVTGIVRSLLLRGSVPGLPEVVESSATPEALHGADAVLAGNAVQGLRAVVRLDATAFPEGPAAAWNAVLRRALFGV
jgi:branched-chain amino acid aminotransferase